MSLQEVMLAFGGSVLLDGVTLQVEGSERICLVGRNGAGKSTLMKIISGEITADAGRVIRSQGLRAASVAQEAPQDLSGTVFEVVAGGLGSIVDLLSEYRSVSNRLACREDYGVISELERIQHLIESSGGWQMSQRVDTILSRLVLDSDASVAGLSVGV